MSRPPYLEFGSGGMVGNYLAYLWLSAPHDLIDTNVNTWRHYIAVSEEWGKVF